MLLHGFAPLSPPARAARAQAGAWSAALQQMQQAQEAALQGDLVSCNVLISAHGSRVDAGTEEFVRQGWRWAGRGARVSSVQRGPKKDQVVELVWVYHGRICTKAC